MAFDLEYNKNNIQDVKLKPCLAHITKIAGVSTYGSPWPTIFYCGDAGRRFLSRGFRPLLSPKCQLEWHGLYSMDNKTSCEKLLFLCDLEESFKHF